MLLLATLLSFAWPRERTIFLSAHDPAIVASRNLRVIVINKCCGSMRPAITGGEVAYVEDYNGRDDLVGFIVVTDSVTHRVVAESRHAVKTSGDANRHSDTWTPKSKLRYVIRYIVRRSPSPSAAPHSRP